MDRDLHCSFTAALCPAHLQQAQDLVGLPSLVDDLVAKGRSEWPALTVPPSAFVAHCAARLNDGAALPDALEQLHASDLYLAFACSTGDEAALRIFRDQYLARLRRVAAKASTTELADDVAQRVLVRLLVPQDGALPVIIKYAGRGSLAGWLDVTATREARSAIRRERPKVDAPDDEIDRLASLAVDADGDPELDGLKKQYRREFKTAFERAFTQLERRERNILRLEHLDGLDGAQIAAVYGVNKSTISRWRQQARETLHRETHKAIQSALQLAPRDLQSVFRLIGSQLDASLTRILREDQ